ncbi:MAG: hypothetical protein LBO73_04225 [Holosporaceae bacterium]|jgi:hypothetical protein|nr:hypothetical protein [Holosporaceae bacterium]
MIFNHEKFINAVKSIHVKPEESQSYESIPDSEVRKKLDEFINYGKNPRFSKALDEICKNLVGRTMFRVLMTKMQTEEKRMHIIPYEDNGSRYMEYVVYINLSFYDASGTGIPSRQYYYIDDEKHEIKTKLKSLAGSIFHEFCHGLHHVSETYIPKKKNVLCLDDTPLGDVWNKDEELRTITCFNNDPICDHCFDLCQSILKKQSFRPRYSHGGWHGKDDSEKRSCLLLHLPHSQEFMDGWREYMI